MKATVFALICLAVLTFFYNRKHPFLRPPLPEGHEYAADGVYFLRAARTLKLPEGNVQWTQGQQLFADRLAKTPAPEGMILVTDGTHSVPVPANMLSEDVQEGQALQQVVEQAQSRAASQAAFQTAQEQALVGQEQALAEQKRIKAEQERAKAEQERMTAEMRAQTEEDRLRRMEAMRPTPTPKFGNTALDQPATRTRSRAIPNYNTPYPQNPYQQ